MIGGDNFLKDIVGYNELLSISNNFKWSDLTLISDFKYYLDYNEDYELVSFLEMTFLTDTQKNELKHKVIISFHEVNEFSIKHIGGSYNQICGLEIIERTEPSWEDQRWYEIRDYEFDRINFRCKKIEIQSVIQI